MKEELVLLNQEIDAIDSIETPNIGLGLGVEAGDKNLLPVEDLALSNSYVKIAETDTDETDKMDWTYQRLRDMLAQLNKGIFEYAESLTAVIKRNSIFKSKYIDCSDRKKKMDHSMRNMHQDKTKLQESLDDLQTKYNSLEQAYEKVKDLAEDNKQTIEKLRGNRDRCVQMIANKNKIVEGLRDQAQELRRKMANRANGFI